MDEPLTAAEARVLGALLEKEHLTPDTYPLTLNSLITACNQTTSRDPVVSYDEAVVTGALDGLTARKFAQTVLVSGSRVTKYRQTLTLQWSLQPRDQAVLCLLLLRGPQTLGELKSRSGRLHEFSDLGEVEETLRRLAEDKYPPRVFRLERQAGMKENRYMHTLCGEEGPALQVADVPVSERLRRLEEEVVALRAEFAAFRQQFE